VRAMFKVNGCTLATLAEIDAHLSQ